MTAIAETGLIEPDSALRQRRGRADSPPTGEPRVLRQLLVLAGSVAIAAALVIAVPELREVLRLIEEMSLGWIAAAIVLELASCLNYVVVFRLFFDDLPARPAREVAWSEMASGVLLPGGGVGGLAVGGWLLRGAGMPMAAIVRRSSGLFLLTSAVNVLVLGLAALLLLTGWATGPQVLALALVPMLLAVAVLAGVWVLPTSSIRAPREDGGPTS